MNWLDAFERIIAILRGPEKTPDQMQASNKSRIITTFCIILLCIVGAFVMNTTSVEQPMKDLAPADKINYETLKLIVVQIFSVLTLILGVNSMTPSAPQPTVTQNVVVDNKDENNATQSS